MNLREGGEYSGTHSLEGGDVAEVGAGADLGVYDRELLRYTKYTNIVVAQFM